MSGRALSLTTIKPSGGWTAPRLGELWQYRDLLYFLVWRDVKVRYKQTALGAAWAVFQPLFTMAVFSVVFGRLAGLPSNGLPYPVFAFSALLPWQLFAFSLSESSTSIVANQRLVSKVYFPRLLLPVAAIGVGLVDFALSFVVMLGLMAYYGIPPGPALVTFPLWALAAVMTALGVGLWLGALNVRYRDVRYTVPFLLQLWMFASPVAYSSDLVPAQWRSLYALNPLVGIVDGFRWALLPGLAAPGPAAAISLAVSAALLISGVLYFRRVESTFADTV